MVCTTAHTNLTKNFIYYAVLVWNYSKVWAILGLSYCFVRTKCG
ncbi:hypothetical protein BQ8482_380102 [Mesorhizobium delmotii]|uniref:Uncharacterized protein n=1 Tax=Mesorhizobium delmotii TaxID=1631247 RepID=A0A2P9ARZ8_9HYPH|nr:hypothetical protein BQ8482_380102 [Mesorhizobium delmotii]